MMLLILSKKWICMHGQLEERVKEALVAEWQDSNRERTSSVLSSKVYERLVRAGVEVPEGEMERILTKLRKRGLIRGAQGHDTAYRYTAHLLSRASMMNYC